MLAETSLEAYHSLSVKTYLQPKEAEVMAAFKRNPQGLYSRQQIASETGMPLHCVCGRVRSLLDKKQLVVLGRAVDKNTRKSQELLGLPIGQQRSLFL